MPPVGFEPTISVGKRSQTHALDRVTIGTDPVLMYAKKKSRPTAIEVQEVHEILLLVRFANTLKQIMSQKLTKTRGYFDSLRILNSAFLRCT